MPRPEPALRMTREDAAEFLASHRTLQLATVDPDGAPHVAETLARRLSGGREPPGRCPELDTARERAVVVISIVRIVSWDHTKL